MTRLGTALIALAATVALSACSGALSAVPAPAPGIPPVAPGAPAAVRAPVPVPPPTKTPPAPSVASTPSTPTSAATPPTQPAAASTTPKDTRTGTQLDKPFTIHGVPIVSRDFPVSAAFKPANQVAPDGVTRETSAALTKLIAGARKDGLVVKVRSGYRSYQTQESMLATKRGNYSSREEELRYIALPGTSEHQTGLAVDLWDGVHWGNSAVNTPLTKWLAAHGREYGFILRYPKGKENVTGYAYEAWHLRYVGTAVSLKFKPNTSQTLEEYLGLA